MLFEECGLEVKLTAHPTEFREVLGGSELFTSWLSSPKFVSFSVVFLSFCGRRSLPQGGGAHRVGAESLLSDGAEEILDDRWLSAARWRGGASLLEPLRAFFEAFGADFGPSR